MLESLYDRANIIRAVQTRFSVKQQEIGDEARPSDVVMTYFTNELGAEPIRELLKQEDPNAVAMDMSSAFRKISASGRGFELLQAVGHGTAGVISYRLGRAMFEGWTTKGFVDDIYSLFFAKAHLEKPQISTSPEAVALFQREDPLVEHTVRRLVLPDDGSERGKIGDFFASQAHLRRLPSISESVRYWIHPSLMSQILEGGQSYQAALDAITPPPRAARRFL